MGRRQFKKDSVDFMSKYDRECAEEFAGLLKTIDRFFIDVTVSCPYSLPHLATFYQGVFAPIPERTMEVFLSAGYRRNGNCLYAMNCETCKGCIPIRLHPHKFKPNRNQKRVWKKNQDISVSMGVIHPTREKIILCDKFLQQRYPHVSNTAQAYYSGFFLNRNVTTFEINYTLRGRLIGNGIVDIGYNWLNAVYFYFDTDEASRSLGTFNILAMLDFCRQKKIEYLYLGYYIKDVSAMSYKVNFRPYFLLIDSKWQEGR